MMGLDFGSTTSSAMVAGATVGLNSASGRMAFGRPEVTYRSEPVFTPFDDEKIDALQVGHYLDQWITESGVCCEDIFAGGVIITGLAAKQTNAGALAQLVGRRMGEAVIATADDPRLESWLAFMGSCSALSRVHPEKSFINLDIGGGTTNPAFGINGNVTHTGCYFIGARHFRFTPGTYRLKGMSPYGRLLLKDLAISKNIGDILSSFETDAILGFYVSALEAMVTGDTGFFDTPAACGHCQVPFDVDAFEMNSAGSLPVLTFSGGIGELIYRSSQGRELPETTAYGDLGIDLARKIITSPVLSAHIQTMIPENMGRATVYGLALHSTEVSGTTIFLSHPECLPCRDLPIVARLALEAPEQEIQKALLLVASSHAGGCIQVLSDSDTKGAPAGIALPPGESLARIKHFGAGIAQSAARLRIQPHQAMVILVPFNYGQVLGNYASNWRQSPVNFIVIDEIPDRSAHFVNVGRIHNNIVPVSFYGIS
jgi:ethanolamine utilization protein EutA